MYETQSILSNSVENFWRAARIYYEHSNAINKQVALSEHVVAAKILPISNENKQDNLFSKMWQNLMEDYLTTSDDIELVSRDKEYLNQTFTCSEGIFILLRKLIPKRNVSSHEYYEIWLLDKGNNKIYIQTKCISQKKLENVSDLKHQNALLVLKYKYVELIYTSFRLKIVFNYDLNEKGIHWMNFIFKPKFINLMSKRNTDNMLSKSLTITRQVNIPEYLKLYEELKRKYAKFLIENWTENTDPKKFVIEDIGIAAYLMLLWNNGNLPRENVKKQKFIDLGCGNGLLVYILNSEGHLGIGFDIRKRTIWERFKSVAVLKEEMIMPGLDTCFPEVDWLIGNHSDELTSWIPIIARNSNSHCQYFVLPCCPFELNGKKFQRRNSSLSCYHDFLLYVNEISNLCNFDTFIDSLRIPSTKRICLIGYRKPIFSFIDAEKVNNSIVTFINENSLPGVNEIISEGSQDQKLKTFKFQVRDPVEKVRNCTKLPPSLIDEILKNVMCELLLEECYISLKHTDTVLLWNRGGRISIQTLAEKINKTLMKQLKKECKGLQTLLKNHYYLFEISKGFVHFRNPESMLEISNNLLKSENSFKWKNRDCWFYKNHPDGCPLADNECSYKH